MTYPFIAPSHRTAPHRTDAMHLLNTFSHPLIPYNPPHPIILQGLIVHPVTGEELPSGEEGELLLKGPQVMLG